MAFLKQPKDGGYCPMCDTVWASPGKCRCESVSISDKVLDPGFYIYREDGSAIFVNGFTKEVWNLAIEAAAKIPDTGYVIKKILELKK